MLCGGYDKPSGRQIGRATNSPISYLVFSGVFVGGRIGYVIFYHFDLFMADPLYLFRVWEGGMSFHGGLLGVIAAMYLYARVTHRRFLAVGDMIAPLVPMGLFFGRMGNFINGELWGRVTDVPWAMIFPSGGPVPRHPSQLYEAALEGLLLFALLWWFQRKPHGRCGQRFILTGLRYSAFYRRIFPWPDAHLGLLSLGMSMGQWLQFR